MRTTNGQSSPQIYRVVNANKGQRMSVKAKLSPQRVKRPVTTKFMTRTERDITSANDEYDEDDFYSDLEEEMADTEWHPHQLKQPKRVLKASPIRPLLQLLSEESSADTRQRPRIHTSLTVNENRKCQDLDVLSEDEETITKFKTEEPEISDGIMEFDNSPQREVPIRNVRRFIWTPKSTSRFLDLWEKHLKDIRGKRKNTLVHKQMAMEMSEYGLTHKEMKFKMDSLTKKYKVELEKIVSGKATNWRYFERVKYLLFGEVDFEQIMFDKADSSPLYEFDHSEAGSQDLDISQEDLQLKEEVEQEEENIKDEPPANVMRMPEKSKLHAKLLSDISASKSDKMLKIEQEKLEIEKQKLMVMKHISQNLESISKTLIELLRNTKK